MAKKKNEAVEQVVEEKTEVVTEAAAQAESNKAVAEGEKDRKKLAKSMKEQELVPIQVSPLYRPYFGRTMAVTINGASVYIPCDGRTYKVPKVFADEIRVRISNQDELFAKKRRLSDVTNNIESSPGELRIF